MKRVMLYPYNKSLAPFVEEWGFDSDKEIVALVALPQSGLVGHRAGYVNNAEYEIEISSDFQDGLNKCDTLYLFEDSETEQYDYMAIAIAALELGKNVVLAFNIPEEKRAALEVQARKMGSNVSFAYEHFLSDNQFANSQYHFKGMYTPKAKVVFVGGLIRNCGQTRICLGLSRTVKNKGYKATVLGCNAAYPIMGYHDMSDLFDDEKTKPVNVIRLLNNLIYKIDTVEEPDVMIIEIPGEIIKYNDFVCGDFGLSMFQVANAVKADSFIADLPYGEYNNEFLENLNRYVERKIDCPIMSYSISNQMLLYNESVEMQNYICFSHSLSHTIEQVSLMRETLKFEVFNTFETEKSRTAYETIIRKLEEL